MKKAFTFSFPFIKCWYNYKIRYHIKYDNDLICTSNLICQLLKGSYEIMFIDFHISKSS